MIVDLEELLAALIAAVCLVVFGRFEFLSNFEAISRQTMLAHDPLLLDAIQL